MTEELLKRIEMINQGKVPNGYKKVFGGIVPCDFKESTFDDLFNFFGGIGIPRNALGEEGIPYLHYGDMHRNSFTSVSYEQYSKLPKYNIKIQGNETYLVNDGDVIFLDASEDLEGTSRCVLIENPENKPFIAGLHTFVAKSKNKELVNEYKQYITAPYYVSKQFMQLSSGFKVYGINRNSIKGIGVAYTKNHKEQKIISAIIMKSNEVVRIHEELIEKFEIQRKALLENLLMPKSDWKTFKVGSLIEEVSLKNKVNCKNVMSVSNKFGFINQEEQFTKQVASKDVKNYKIVSKDDIAYNPSRINVGSIAIYQNEEIGIVSPMYVVFRCTKISPDLLLLLLSTNRGKYDIETFLSGSVRNSLNFLDLGKIDVKLPCKSEQEKIVRIFKSVDMNIQLYKQKVAKLMEQQRAIIQLLLTGIVRVN